MKHLLYYSLLTTLMITSCRSFTPYTEQLQKEHGWDEEDLRRIQFYLSEDIVLRRELAGATDEIINGDVKIIDGRRVEVVTIKRGTPGVLEFKAKENKYAVRFEQGGDRYLMFGPNPRYSKRYMLLASEWNRRRGKVNYDGKRYTTDGGSQLAGLMIDLRKIGNTEVKSRTATGVKVR